MSDQQQKQPSQQQQPQPDDPYAHLRAIIAKSKDPHAVKAAQDHIDRLTAAQAKRQQ